MSQNANGPAQDQHERQHAHAQALKAKLSATADRHPVPNPLDTSKPATTPVAFRPIEHTEHIK
jgi:hypothetical protein